MAVRVGSGRDGLGCYGCGLVWLIRFGLSCKGSVGSVLVRLSRMGMDDFGRAIVVRSDSAVQVRTGKL